MGVEAYVDGACAKYSLVIDEHEMERSSDASSECSQGIVDSFGHLVATTAHSNVLQ